jgi:sentrin-specific protease 1
VAEWLNDEAINYYLGLLQERELAKTRAKAPRLHFHSTFFYNKLFADKRRYEYSNTNRWTPFRKLNYCILDCDLIVVPVH